MHACINLSSLRYARLIVIRGVPRFSDLAIATGEYLRCPVNCGGPAFDLLSSKTSKLQFMMQLLLQPRFITRSCNECAWVLLLLYSSCITVCQGTSISMILLHHRMPVFFYE